MLHNAETSLCAVSNKTLLLLLTFHLVPLSTPYTYTHLAGLASVLAYSLHWNWKQRQYQYSLASLDTPALLGSLPNHRKDYRAELHLATFRWQWIETQRWIWHNFRPLTLLPYPSTLGASRLIPQITDKQYTIEWTFCVDVLHIIWPLIPVP